MHRKQQLDIHYSYSAMNHQQMRVIYQSQECYQIQILQEISELNKIQQNELLLI